MFLCGEIQLIVSTILIQKQLANMKNNIIIVANNINSIIPNGLKTLLEAHGQYVSVDLVSEDSIERMKEISLPENVVWIVFNGACDKLNTAQLEHIRSISSPSSPILLFIDSESIQEDIIRKVMSFGKIGIASTHISIQEVNNYIHEIQDKNFVLSDDYKEALINAVLHKKSSFHQLSILLNNKEQKILDAAKKGFNIKQTAEMLNLSKNTIAAYRSKMMRQAGVHSIASLIAKVGL